MLLKGWTEATNENLALFSTALASRNHTLKGHISPYNFVAFMLPDRSRSSSASSRRGKFKAEYEKTFSPIYQSTGGR